MPTGRTHDRITLWLLPWLTGLSVLVTRSGELTLYLVGGFLFSGLLFGPDLDIYSRQYKRWGIFRWLWLPYQRMFKHRSWLTHGPIIGTSLRIIYLGFFLCIFLLICQGLGLIDNNSHEIILHTLKTSPRQIIALVVGLELGSLSHSLSDWLGSSLKKRSPRRKK
jgi:uncharacterized metal-binding protein